MLVSELTELEGAGYCTTICGLYMFTGVDVASEFKGKGNGEPLKKRHPKYHDAFRKLVEWSTQSEVTYDSHLRAVWAGPREVCQCRTQHHAEKD